MQQIKSNSNEVITPAHANNAVKYCDDNLHDDPIQDVTKSNKNANVKAKDDIGNNNDNDKAESKDDSDTTTNPSKPEIDEK